MAGDPGAFASLVLRFQDMAVGYAYTILGDPFLAEDAAQEAFVEAHRDLVQLREPMAFSAWLRRLVFKQCDRLVRRKQLTTVPLDAATYVRSTTATPLEEIEANETSDTVRQAIQGLPYDLRVPTTLYYISDYSQQEIVDFLDVPISTVKKRLYEARKRLRKGVLQMAAEHLRNKRPSQDDKLAIKVQFLIAVKQGDLKRVERLLRDAPELAQTQTEWSPSSTTRLWPYGATALHWAAGTGDVELAKLLLAHGGDVNAGAPSRSGQTPLHEAVNMGQGELVQLLIEHGADVNASTGAGMTPLHNAALRNQLEIARLLINGGAEVTSPTKKGYRPADWAALRGHSSLADLLVEHGANPPKDRQQAALAGSSSTKRRRKIPTSEEVLGRVIDGLGQPVDHGSLLDNKQRQPVLRSMTEPASAILETGIKIIDLMSPIRRGGSVGLFTPVSGVGLIFVVGQILQSALVLHDSHVVYMGLQEEGHTAWDRQNELRVDMGVDNQIFNERAVFVYGNASEPQSEWANVAETGLTVAADLQKQGHDVLLAVDGKLNLSADIVRYLRVNTGSTPNGAITTLHVGHHTVGLEPPHLADLDTTITFSRDRALQSHYPAIDPVRSTSGLLTSDLIDVEHIDLAEKARMTIRRYDDGLHHSVERAGLDGLLYLEDAEADGTVAVRARRLHRFLTQPLPSAERYIGMPGVYVGLKDTLAGCKAILSGEYDSTPEEAFYMVGAANEAA